MEQVFYDALERQGYVVQPLLTRAEVDYLRLELDKLLTSLDFFPPPVNSSHPTFHVTAMSPNVAYKRRTLQLFQEVFASHVEKTLGNYRILNGNFFIKPPGRGELGLHRHWQFVENRDDTAITLWCPLIDVDESNGTMEVIPGSHRLAPWDISAVTCRPFFESVPDTLLKQFAVPVKLRAGEVIFFDNNLLHGSPANPSPHLRPALQGLCIPAQAQPALFYAAAHTADLFDVFAIDSDFFVERALTSGLSRPDYLPRLGQVPNRSYQLTPDEFRRGLTTTCENKLTQGWLSKLRHLFTN